MVRVIVSTLSPLDDNRWSYTLYSIQQIERANTQVQVSDTVTLNCSIILLRPIADGKDRRHMSTILLPEMRKRSKPIIFIGLSLGGIPDPSFLGVPVIVQPVITLSPLTKVSS